MTTIEDIFGEEGVFAQHFSNYEIRPGQIELARAIHSSVEEERFLVAEGPTGIGKSFAYLVPAILSVDSKKVSKVIVATANIALQEQLIEKDLPTLDRIMPIEFTYGLLKGRNNYLCTRKFLDFRSKQQTDYTTMKEDRDILAWADRTETGDKSELSFEYKKWRRISSGQGECLGGKCPHKGGCFANVARIKAISKNIIVCNYHVLLKARLLIPEHQLLICDEAHDLEDVARSALGWQLSSWTFRNIADWVRPHQGMQSNLSRRIIDASDRLFEEIKEIIGRWENFRLEQAGWADITTLTELLTRASTVAARVANSTDNEVLEAQAEAIGELIGEAINHLYQAKDVANEDWVYWLSKDKGPPERFFVHGAPILVNEILPGVLYSGVNSALFISATMTSGSSFEFIRDQLGIPMDAGELIAPSPFDLKEQGIIVVPRDMPPPDTRDQSSAEDFYDAVAGYALELIHLCGGKTLLLFTSWRSLNYVYDQLMKAKLPYRILKQGHAPRMKLLEEFKRDVNSVLLGVASFWQGVDVPGEALTGLLIDKIPFPVPTDPIQDAIGDYIERNGGSPFFKRAVPHATIALSQGIGRLIRTKEDRGVVVITDNRLITKNYGGAIIRALPHLKKVRSFEKAEGFLNGRREAI